MRKIAGVLLVVFLGWYWMIARSSLGPVEFNGSLRLETYDGHFWDLNRFEGKPIVLHFFATWCPPCIEEMPVFSMLSEQYKNDIFFVGLAIESPQEDVIKLVNKFNIKYPISKGNLSQLNQFGFSSLPAMVILDANKKPYFLKEGVVKLDELKNILKRLF